MDSIMMQLKALKLSGMADVFNALIKEAAANQIGNADFISLLLEDERLERQRKQSLRRYKNAEFTGFKTLESFDFSANPKINQSMIQDLATCRFIKEGSHVIIEGPCGTGKTPIAQAIGHCAVQNGYDVILTSQTKLAQQLQSAKALNTYEQTMKRIAKVPLLIIDDFGLKPLRSPEDEYLHELIAERSEFKSTLITSNLSTHEWHQAFPNKLLGAATIDHLVYNAYRLTIEGKSYRAIKNLQKGDDMTT